MELIIIIIGVLVAVFGASVYYKGKRTNELTLIYSNKLIESTANECVEMLYLGKPTSHFVRYEITLFNSGNRDITPSDFFPEPELAFHFNDLQVISEKAGFANEGTVPHYQIESPEVVVYFERLKPNQHMTVEVLTGSHHDQLTPPVCDSVLRGGHPVKLHHQLFDQADAHKRYRHLTKHTALMMLSFAIGTTGLFTGLYSKFQTYFVGKQISAEQQFIHFFSVDSLPWLAVSIVSIIALLYSYECLKVISPKFRRYKFEHLIQNRD
ncbi:hypothetical protein [Leucothrix arctica]|uniref:Uncharacterized protein n=1 Tax=Leucothrix arctica TaxID=1481894 RepID=A0A317C7F3_9GAMM|nr:hypothetical protein [Leucothrix arctica]PWQ94239.1 hypothetical protein DKT75_17035 [Leucothrix arctica]